MTTVYASIGNSDDKLTQQRWAEFCQSFVADVRHRATQVHGEWYSRPDAGYQNAAMCFEIDDVPAIELRWIFQKLAAQFDQDSIAWAVAPVTEFLPASLRPTWPPS